MDKSVIVTGGSGLLGRDVVSAFKAAGWKTTGTALSRVSPPSVVELDLRQSENITKLLDHNKPDVVIHCAANRFPDQVEADPLSATALNVDASRALAAACQARSIILIYISTDYVFSGAAGEAPYKPLDTPSPTTSYGRTKYEGEVAVLDEIKTANKGVVLRVSLLYGHCEDNDKSRSAVHVLLDALYKADKQNASEPVIKVDDYALRYPLYTGDVGKVLVEIANKYAERNQATELPRILHFTGKQCLTKWEMTNILADIMGMTVKNLKPSDPSKDAARESVQRPYNTQLDMSDLDKIGIAYGRTDFEGWW